MSSFDESLEGPKFVQLFGPVIAALNRLGGSARPSEVRDVVAGIVSLTDEEAAELTSSGTVRFDNKVNWARFYLAKAGVIDASRRGVWTLTEKGRALPPMTHDTTMALFREVQSQFKSAAAAAEILPDEGEADAPSDEAAVSAGRNHRALVIQALRNLTPAGFEAFSQRLLRESGFQDVKVTGRSGDGGIDGIGILEVNPLVSFKVLFQCKRYAGTVTPSQVRDFRGAMMGRADKGIILTTGSFTSEARKEGVRDGVPPIELVDGEKLVNMLEELELGLVPVRAYRIDDSFFDDFS
ncbi:MAG: restriction endonuclease [Coriobacteriia bacterium]|nr:restriction endonuclease [Coriobacteriia bacterium]